MVFVYHCGGWKIYATSFPKFEIIKVEKAGQFEIKACLEECIQRLVALFERGENKPVWCSLPVY